MGSWWRASILGPAGCARRGPRRVSPERRRFSVAAVPASASIPDEILAELGYSDAEIAALRAEGIEA